MWLFVCGVLWSDLYGTDGLIPHEALAGLAPGLQPAKVRRLAGRLVEAGLWESAIPDWVIHDFHHYQRTAKEARDLRERQARKRAATRERVARYRARLNGVTHE